MCGERKQRPKNGWEKGSNAQTMGGKKISTPGQWWKKQSNAQTMGEKESIPGQWVEKQRRDRDNGWKKERNARTVGGKREQRPYNGWRKKATPGQWVEKESSARLSRQSRANLHSSVMSGTTNRKELRRVYRWCGKGGRQTRRRKGLHHPPNAPQHVRGKTTIITERCAFMSHGQLFRLEGLRTRAARDAGDP